MVAIQLCGTSVQVKTASTAQSKISSYSFPEGNHRWSSEDNPREGVPHWDSPGEEGESVKLGAACDELELVWVVGSCAAGRHWCDCRIYGDYVCYSGFCILITRSCWCFFLDWGFQSLAWGPHQGLPLTFWVCDPVSFPCPVGLRTQLEFRRIEGHLWGFPPSEFQI